MKVLCFGSLNIDYTYKVEHFVSKVETLSSKQLEVYTGGKGLNQSVALAKAGAIPYHAGAIGEDGKFLLDELHMASVNTDFVAVLENVRTGHAIIQNDKQGDNCILLYGGANQLITEQQVDQVLSNFEKGDFLLLQNEINALPYIMEQAYKSGMKIVLNSSPMNDRILELPLKYVSYFILNEIEASQILGNNITEITDGEEPARQLLKRFPDVAIFLTLGSKGSIYLDGNECVKQSIYHVYAVDTTAAGDTFTGYFIAAVIEGRSIQEALRMAAKASSIAVSRPGATPSIPRADEVKKELGML